VDGVDIEPGASARGSHAASCRLYGASGVPPRELLAKAIESARARRAARRRWPVALAGLPAAGLAVLPACPACYPLYAGVLSSLGLTAFVAPGTQTALTAVLLALALGALAFRARGRRGYAPLALGLAASLVLLAGRLLWHSTLLAYAGAAALVVAGAWNAWPAARGSSGCDACLGEEEAR
jgi:hypothetical protein